MVRKVITPVAITIILFTAVVSAQTIFNDWNRDTGDEALVWATAEDCDLFTGRQSAKGETLLEPDSTLTKRQIAEVLYRFKQRLDSEECEVTTTTSDTTAANTTTTTLATTTVPVTTTAASTTENVIWEAILEPGDVWSGRTFGFREGSAGDLSDTTITYNDVEYTVNILFTFNNSIRVAITDQTPDLRTTLLSEIPNAALTITSVNDPSVTFSGTITTSLLGPNTIDFRWPTEEGFALVVGERYQVRLTTGIPTVATTTTTSTTISPTTTTTPPDHLWPTYEVSWTAREGWLIKMVDLPDGAPQNVWIYWNMRDGVQGENSITSASGWIQCTPECRVDHPAGWAKMQLYQDDISRYHYRFLDIQGCLTTSNVEAPWPPDYVGCTSVWNSDEHLLFR